MSKQWSDRIGRRLKLRDLHILLAVGHSGSMGKAASNLAVSQPAVSKAISDLEYVLGVRLFDRSPQGIEPTMYGRALLKCGVAVFDDLRQGVKELEFLTDPAAGEVTIGCTEPLAAGFVAVVIDRLSPRYPNAVFKVIASDAVTLYSRELRGRSIELALVPMTGLALEKDTDVQVLFDDPHVVLAGTKSKWTRRRNIALTDLINEPWVLPPWDTPSDCTFPRHSGRPGWSRRALTCLPFRYRCTNTCWQRGASSPPCHCRCWFTAGTCRSSRCLLSFLPVHDRSGL
jgi:DNA-binding transcriptional LysR family regulator